MLFLQIFISILLILAIIPQGTGAGLASVMQTTSYHTRKGIEGIIFKATIVLTVFFTLVSILTIKS